MAFVIFLSTFLNQQWATSQWYWDYFVNAPMYKNMLTVYIHIYNYINNSLYSLMTDLYSVFGNIFPLTVLYSISQICPYCYHGNTYTKNLLQLLDFSLDPKCVGFLDS